MFKILSAQAIARRKKWVEKICQIDGGFAESAVVLQKELEKEVKKEGVGALHDHLRLCGHIPKSYGRYSSEEKLYSKYTDALLSVTYKYLG